MAAELAWTECSSYLGRVSLLRLLRLVVPRLVAMVLIATIALLCLGDVVTLVMAASGEHHCFGSACQDQIACGQPVTSQVTPGFTGHLVAVPATGEAAPALERMQVPLVGPPLMRAARRPVAQFAPRSPPLA